ncbi:unnamed protein product [Orchesella dallaii]|uniref:CRAL/TRIO N-terminal domain-containing protein n=1 Tax=Orchesella dallaii TaxID=48710 RepID=A0ABP1R5S7_9HEXA
MVDANSNEVSQVDQGLKEMREWYQEFQEKENASKDVCQFLENSFKDEALLRRFLIGRKYRVKHACETLQTYAEMRFDKYPDMFPAYVPEKECFLVEDEQENPIFGVLKERDSKGRRIVYFNASKL